MVAVVVQARMGSSRLPGKVLRPLAGRPVLSWVLRAARESGVAGPLVVATTSQPADDDVATLAREEGAGVVRGPVEDVLTRFLLVLDEVGDQPVVRLTADCPLLDPALVALAVRVFETSGADYVSTVLQRTLPRGLDIEVVAAAALRCAGREATSHDRAHVTSFIHARAARFDLLGLSFAPAAADLRVTLDEEADAAVLEGVVERTGDRAPGWREVVAVLRDRPELAAVNAHVMQKRPEEG